MPDAIKPWATMPSAIFLNGEFTIDLGEGFFNKFDAFGGHD